MHHHLRAKIISGVLLVASHLQAAPDAGGWKAPRFHDPSTPIREGNTWWVFATGDGIVTRTSADLKNWQAGPPVFKTFPAWHREVVPDQRGYLWAPDIVKRGNRYFLYYSVSAWGKNTSAIGLASNTTLDPAAPGFAWKDEGIIIRSNDRDPYNAIDPQIFADADNSLWMVFGSFWTGIQLIELDPKTGLRHPEHKNVTQLAWNQTIEAASLLKHGGYYYLFVNWGLCCRGVDSTYEIRVGRSREIRGPYVDASGNKMSTGGGTLFLKSRGDQIGPGHPSFVEEQNRIQMFYHYYDRQRHGMSTIGDMTLRWTRDKWPEG